MPDFPTTSDHTDTRHDGTSHLAANNTFVRRILTLLALKTSGRIYKSYGRCRPVSPHLIVKTGGWVHLTEAATMKFIAENTSIPVPKVHCAFVRKNVAYIVMERIQGENMPEVMDMMSDEEKEMIWEQLKDMVQEFRALKSSEGMLGVQSRAGGSLRDHRIPHARPRFGPFKTIQEFHRWLRKDFDPDKHLERKDEQDWKDIKAMVDKQDGPWPPPVFTHGDLNPGNILGDGGKIVGIIDWDFSGWYPHYWEYTAAWYTSRLMTSWQGHLGKFLEPFPEELQMDIVRQKWWGDF